MAYNPSGLGFLIRGVSWQKVADMTAGAVTKSINRGTQTRIREYTRNEYMPFKRSKAKFSDIFPPYTHTHTHTHTPLSLIQL